MKELTIEEARETLNNMLNTTGIVLSEGLVLQLSQELDELINDYYQFLN